MVLLYFEADFARITGIHRGEKIKVNMMKITRRTVDPITFTERVGIEFIPRIEDSVLDDQLAGSMSYEAPRNIPSNPTPPLPPPPPPSEECRPPTPPKLRGKADPNTPRNPSKSPAIQKKIAHSPGGLVSPGGTFLSPRSRTKRKSLSSHLMRVGENDEMSEGSMSNLSALQTSISRIEVNEDKKVKAVRFADENELNEISRMRNSVIAEIFWASDEIANFRYEAFMEEAGLDLAEFD